MWKYLAILKDSLLETIDSKVFFVVLGILVVAIFLMATLSLTPSPGGDGLQKLTERFPDGSDEVPVPIFGKVKMSDPLTQYMIRDVQGPTDQKVRPWEGEYSFTLEAHDLRPLGSRLAVLRYILVSEEQRERMLHKGQQTRWQLLNAETLDEAARIVEREEKKTKDQGELRRRLLEQVFLWRQQRLEKEARSLSAEELEGFVREQLEGQGSWNVTEVKSMEVPPAERIFPIKAKVLVREGQDDFRTKTEERDGEMHRFAVKVRPRNGTYLAWPHQATMFFGAMNLGSNQLPGNMFYTVAHYFIGWFGAPIIMLLGFIITASYIPNMLRKGTIDLLLAKPVSRLGLLLYKYLGGLTFMFLNTVPLVVGLWLILGLRTGVWEATILLMIPVLSIEFALFYALSTLVGVLTRSPIVCILGCILLWFILWGIGASYYYTQVRFKQGIEGPGPVTSGLEYAHMALPHYLDLDWLTDWAVIERSLPEAERVERAGQYSMFHWPETLTVTGLYIGLLLGLAGWRFSVADY